MTQEASDVKQQSSEPIRKELRGGDTQTTAAPWCEIRRDGDRGKVVSATLQSDQLSQQLLCGAYECMVCCESVRERHEVWSCRSCFHIFHLQCVHHWAKSPVATVNEGIYNDIFN